MAGKYEIKTTESGKFHFNLKAGNGQIIISSGVYASRDAAMAAIKDAQGLCSKDECFERKESKNGEPYFVFNGSDGKMLGRSEMYSSKASMENGVESVKKNGDSDNVVDVEA